MSLSFSVCLSPLLQPAPALNPTQELLPSQLMLYHWLMTSTWRSPLASLMCCFLNRFHSPLYQVPLLAQLSPTVTATPSAPLQFCINRNSTHPSKLISNVASSMKAFLSLPPIGNLCFLQTLVGFCLYSSLGPYHILTRSWGIHVCARLFLPLVKEVLKKLDLLFSSSALSTLVTSH